MIKKLFFLCALSFSLWAQTVNLPITYFHWLMPGYNNSTFIHGIDVVIPLFMTSPAYEINIIYTDSWGARRQELALVLGSNPTYKFITWEPVKIQTISVKGLRYDESSGEIFPNE